MMEKSSLRLADTRSVREAARSAARELGYPDLKPEQLKVVEMFIKGCDVFAVLPTGYRKSLCYACLPIIFDKLLGSNSSIVLVVTPLTAIMKDQVVFLMCKFIRVEVIM